ncbi:hypothetical protein BCR44DRAFT_198077 [Catenaria anguillulae PL171]|uniref:Uncharacterized protein n=1 Tax=Catenaria anguillulae PL171 TaxID=765915 RepID=A0A1Y2H9K2_9FUNG|nr:hypothetical protein BCR44DRAFT_198077 [Catenaria anguillulae PL171]
MTAAAGGQGPPPGHGQVSFQPAPTPTAGGVVPTGHDPAQPSSAAHSRHGSAPNTLYQQQQQQQQQPFPSRPPHPLNPALNPDPAFAFQSALAAHALAHLGVVPPHVNQHHPSPPPLLPQPSFHGHSHHPAVQSHPQFPPHAQLRHHGAAFPSQSHHPPQHFSLHAQQSGAIEQHSMSHDHPTHMSASRHHASHPPAAAVHQIPVPTPDSVVSSLHSVLHTLAQSLALHSQRVNNEQPPPPPPPPPPQAAAPPHHLSEPSDRAHPSHRGSFSTISSNPPSTHPPSTPAPSTSASNSAIQPSQLLAALQAIGLGPELLASLGVGHEALERAAQHLQAQPPCAHSVSALTSASAHHGHSEASARSAYETSHHSGQPPQPSPEQRDSSASFQALPPQRPSYFAPPIPAFAPTSPAHRSSMSHNVASTQPWPQMHSSAPGHLPQAPMIPTPAPAHNAQEVRPHSDMTSHTGQYAPEHRQPSIHGQTPPLQLFHSKLNSTNRKTRSNSQTWPFMHQ